MKQSGFSLVELIAVMVIMAVLSATFTSSILPVDTTQLQASRDSIVAAFQSAQQLAMVRQKAVVLTTTNNSITITLDGADVAFGGVEYPITLPPGQTLTTASFSYNRLGFTTAGNLQLSQRGDVVTITIEASGYVF